MVGHLPGPYLASHLPTMFGTVENREYDIHQADWSIWPLHFNCGVSGPDGAGCSRHRRQECHASVADLSNLPQQIVKATDHGTPATFEGVLLTDVLAKVDLPLGEKFHSTGASYYLTVEAKDGYRAVFAWAELDSTFMDKAVYVGRSGMASRSRTKTAPFSWWCRVRSGPQGGFGR